MEQQEQPHWQQAIEQVEQEPSNFILTEIEKIRFEVVRYLLGNNNITLEEFIRISRKYDKLKINIKLRATTTTTMAAS